MNKHENTGGWKWVCFCFLLSELQVPPVHSPKLTQLGLNKRPSGFKGSNSLSSFTCCLDISVLVEFPSFSWWISKWPILFIQVSLSLSICLSLFLFFHSLSLSFLCMCVVDTYTSMWVLLCVGQGQRGWGSTLGQWLADLIWCFISRRGSPRPCGAPFASC